MISSQNTTPTSASKCIYLGTEASDLSKQFTEINEKWISSIAVFYYVEGALYELVEDYECVGPKVRIEHNVKTPTVEYCCQKMTKVPGELVSLEEGKENNVIAGYRYRSEACWEGEELYSLLNKMVSQVLINSIKLMTPYTHVTSQSGIEYLLAVLSDGKGYLIEGEENKIVVPISKALFSLHTHPNNCLLSPHDVRSLSNTLMYRGIGGGVISRDCYLILVRSGPFTEDDLMDLMKFRNALRKMKVDDLNHYLKRGFIGTSLRIHTNYFHISQL
ncbi:MAG: hypothetical protein QXL29_04780 [Zestosphaera sp.]